MKSMASMESRRQDIYLDLLRKRGQLIDMEAGLGGSRLVSLAQLPLRMPRTLKNKNFSDWLEREKVWANVYVLWQNNIIQHFEIFGTFWKHFWWHFWKHTQSQTTYFQNTEKFDGSNVLKFLKLTIFCLFDRTHFPWSLDDQCNFYSVQFGQHLPILGLVSYPSSGNTWLRYLIEGRDWLLHRKYVQWHDHRTER